MADGTPIMIWVTDREGGIRFVNQAYCHFFGVTAPQVIEKGWQILLHPDDRQHYLDTFFSACNERKPFRGLVRVRRHDGRWRWVESQGEPLFSSAGEFMGMAGSSPDVTEREEFAAELERLVNERTAELQEISSELEQVSYAMTHDMRAPLRAMRGFAELLLQESSDAAANPQAREHLRTIIRSARRLDLLIRDTLCYTKTVRGELPLNPVDLNRLLREMLQTYPQFQPDAARIHVAGPLPLVQGNEAALVQCFSSLLDNAVKFAKPGSTPEVLIRPARRGGGRARIYVQDHGIGITPAVLPKVFNFFSRGSRDMEGTGAGLALVRKAVQRMGGQVGVDSEPGEGSAFWIELPEAEDRP